MLNSNQTGLRIAEEATPKTLPGTPVWYPVEPNSYGDFGAEIKTTARAPIASDRQRRKGSVTDLDASAGFQTDLTTKSLSPFMQGFMFADWRKKTELSATAVTGASYTVAAGGAGFPANSLLFAEGFATAGNNGLKLVTASTGTSVSVAGLTAGAETGTLYRVGIQGASGDLTLTVGSGKLELNSAAVDLTTLGVIPGEWLFIGGDAAVTAFATAACNGFYRVESVAAGKIVFDTAPDGAAADAGTGKTIRVFLGQVLKNEADSTLQVKRTYQAERTYASDKVEYVTGLMANTLKVTTKTADKLTAELEFVGLDSETAGAQKSGTRPAVQTQTAFSSSSDVSRLRLRKTSDGTDLATYLTDLEFTVDNGVDADKAIGSLGGVDHSLGDFMVSGTVEAYFSSLDAVDAVKANATVGLDVALVADVAGNAAGWVFDIPSIDLGDARLKVEKDKKVKLPLNLEANAHATLNHTMLVVNFQYLPQLAL